MFWCSGGIERIYLTVSTIKNRKRGGELRGRVVSRGSGAFGESVFQ